MTGKVVYYLPSATQRPTEYNLIGVRDAVIQVENRGALDGVLDRVNPVRPGRLFQNRHFSLFSLRENLTVDSLYSLDCCSSALWDEPVLSLIPLLAIGLNAALQNNTVASNHKFGRYGCDDSYNGILPHIYAALCDCTVHHPVTVNSVMNSKILADFRYYLRTEIVMP